MNRTKRLFTEATLSATRATPRCPESCSIVAGQDFNQVLSRLCPYPAGSSSRLRACCGAFASTTDSTALTITKRV
jgi:hypothetical protein